MGRNRWRYSGDKILLNYDCRKNERQIHEAVRHGADVNARDAAGWTPLYFETVRRKARIMECLINLGARVDLQTTEGDTPLHRAAEKDDVDSAIVLLQAGADWGIRNKSGVSPKALARARRSYRVLELITSFERAQRNRKSLDDSLMTSRSSQGLTPGI